MSSLTKKGIDVRRRLQTRGTHVGDEIRDLQTHNTSLIIYRAVVVDVISDPDELTDEDLDAISMKISNQDLLSNVPRNSILARVISGGADRRTSDIILCYPFFSQHIALPVKPAEQVWVIYESQESHTIGYWISRIPDQANVDDLNYTHGDRKFDIGTVKTASEKSSGKKYTPAFQNGGGSPDTQSLSGAPDEFDKIYKSSRGSKKINCEPVPRFVKRPGDTVFQGSNNTLICMGEDRLGNPQSPSKGSGTIDIVVGRGRFSPKPGADPADSQCRTILNSRGFEETDKDPEISGKTRSKMEGNPDPVNDASRIYVSMNAEGDLLFDKESTLPKAFDGSFTDQKGAFLIAKSDHIRLIARTSSKDSIAGSIRIVKEGTKNGDQSALIMQPNGDVQIDGNRLFLGRLGQDGSNEPYIKYSEFQSLISGILDDLNSFTQDLATTFASNTTPGYGSPSPQLVASAGKECAKLIAKIAERKTQIPRVKSKRIFGE